MALDVPTMALEVRPAVPVMPVPRVPMHREAVLDDHVVVEHIARPSIAVTVVSVGAKFMPDRVTLDVTDATL